MSTPSGEFYLALFLGDGQNQVEIVRANEIVLAVECTGIARLNVLAVLPVICAEILSIGEHGDVLGEANIFAQDEKRCGHTIQSDGCQ